MIEVDQRILLRSERYPDGLDSRVEQADADQPDRLAIAPPARNGVEVALEPDDELELEWTTDEDGSRSIRVRVVGDAGMMIPALEVELLGSSQGVQRRDNVRLPVSLGLSIWEIVDEDEDEPPPMIGSVFDLSGGGMQARIPRRLKVGERFWVRFELPERGFIEVEAIIRRHIAGDVYGLEFCGMTPGDRERIIRTIFFLMREQLARRSGRRA